MNAHPSHCHRLALMVGCCVIGIASPLLAQVPFSQQTPHWIWSADGSSSDESIPNGLRFEKRFDIPQVVSAATLRLAADFCWASVELNGHFVLSVEPYSPTVELDVTAYLVRGENRIVVRANPGAGPSAIALSLLLDKVDRSQMVISSDGSWKVARDRPGAAGGVNKGTGMEGAAVGLGPVEPELWGVGRRAATLDAFENYEQWRIASGTAPTRDQPAFWTAPGFQITLLRKAQPNEGSWVSMAFDPQGRLTIAREDRGLLRMTLAKSRREIENVQTINEDLLECRGLLYAYGALYANANNSKGLYRLRDTDGDDHFDEIRRLREFPGGVGHGRNDLALGPDGLIYSIHGDAVDVPTENVADRTSPLREVGRGKKSSEGTLVRTDREGKRWEVICSGLRNPFGIAVHSNGDLFTYDADAEFDMGTPWYRPTRIVPLLSGADYGWRGVTGRWPPYFPDHPDNALPVLDIGKGSPTAVAFGKGEMFPAPYNHALFILDWAYGRILAVHLAPRGAGYRALAETFLQGRPLNLTDLTFGPDGALYLVTGGRGTQSALYQVSYTGHSAAPHPESSPHARACQEHADAVRKLRPQLAVFHGQHDPRAIDVAWPQLDNSDPMIRYAARIAVEHQPLETWRDRALAERRTTASLTALVALARCGDPTMAEVIVDRLVAVRAAELDLGQALLLLHSYSLVLASAPGEWVPRKQEVVAQLLDLRAAAATSGLQVSPVGMGANLRRELARLLVQLRAPSAMETTLQFLLRSEQQEDRLQALFLLRNIREGWTPDTRREYFTALGEMPRFLGGEGMPKFLAHLREESLATLSEAERTVLADVIGDKSDETIAEPVPPVRPVIKKWTVEEFSGWLADPSRPGEAVQGEIVFREAQCARCHRVGARGAAVGPDLSYVGRRFSRRDMLESILAPSKVVAENYRNVEVTMKDGRVLVGRVLVEGDYRSEKVRLASDPLNPAAVVEIHKRDIEEYRLSDTSPMPSGLLDGFQQQEIVDLLAYLQAGSAGR